MVYEHAVGSRFLLLLILFGFYMFWTHLRELLQAKIQKYLTASFFVDIILLALMDYSSKYVVDYYFNIYYFFVLIEVGMLLERKKRLFLSFAVIAAAFIKFYRLFGEYNAPYILSYIFFILMVFITVAIFFNYSRILSEEKAKLNQLNLELKKANEMLEEKNLKIKELAIFEERNRIAREIHDSVGHNLTGLIMNLDYCGKLIDVDPGKVKNQVTACRNIAKESLSEIRKSVQALKPKSVENLTLVKSLEELIENSGQVFNLEISLKVEGTIYKTVPDFNIVIYRALQEGITNSTKHGNATRIDITITYGHNSFSMLIKDNGKGTNKFSMGNGLTGMSERVKEFKGEVSFYKNDGFMINISVPSEEISDE
jgi:signal transduction histidine kinase